MLTQYLYFDSNSTNIDFAFPNLDEDSPIFLWLNSKEVTPLTLSDS